MPLPFDGAFSRFYNAPTQGGTRVAIAHPQGVKNCGGPDLWPRVNNV